MSGDRHVEISRWFGELESTFYKHHKSPHPDVFRVSNDEEEGCTGVGRTGWHVDGSFQPAPFSYALYHIWSVPTQGDTGVMSLQFLQVSHNFKGTHTVCFSISFYNINQKPTSPRTKFPSKTTRSACSSG